MLARKGLGLEFSLWAMAGEESAQLFGVGSTTWYRYCRIN
jgi:hypothetical protein